jgi:hypothetical protein
MIIEPYNDTYYEDVFIPYIHLDSPYPDDLGIKRRDYWGDGEFHREHVIKHPFNLGKKKRGKNKNWTRSYTYVRGTERPPNKKQLGIKLKRLIVSPEEVLVLINQYPHIDYEWICDGYFLNKDKFKETMNELIHKGLLIVSDCQIEGCYCVDPKKHHIPHGTVFGRNKKESYIYKKETKW